MPPKKSPQPKSKPSSSTTKKPLTAVHNEDAASTQILQANTNNNNKEEISSSEKKLSLTQQPPSELPSQKHIEHSSSLPFISAIPLHVQRFISKIASPTGTVNFEKNNQNEKFLDLLRDAATSKKGLLGSSLDGGDVHHSSVTSCLCSLGFHLVGSAPLFSTTSCVTESIDETETDGNISNNSEHKTSRRQREAEGEDAKDDDNEMQNHKNIQSSSSPLPPSQWTDEVMSFPSCSHSVCRTCALHHFTLQLLLLQTQNNSNESSQKLSLECSFCASKGKSSSLNLEVPSENEIEENVPSSFSEKMSRLLESNLPPEKFKTHNESSNSSSCLSWKLFLVNGWEKYHEKNNNIQHPQKKLSQDDASNNNNHNDDDEDATTNNQISLTQQTRNICGVCEESQGTNWCYDCGFALCQDCLKSVHSKGKFKKHDVVDGIPSNNNNANNQVPVSPSTSVVSAKTNRNHHNNQHNNQVSNNRNLSLDVMMMSMFSNNNSNYNHNLISLSSNCPLHPSYPIELFCSDCSKTACLMCHFSGSHKNHKVSPLTEVQQKAQQDIQQYCNSLMEISSNNDENKNNNPFFNNNFSSVLSARSKSVSSCADDVLSLCDQVFEKIQETVAERKKKIVEKIIQWKNQSQVIAKEDFVILSWAAESMKNILDSCKPVFASDDEVVENNNNNQKDKGSVTSDTLILRDAVRFRVENLMSSSLVQQLNQLVVAASSTNHNNKNGSKLMASNNNNHFPLRLPSSQNSGNDGDDLLSTNENNNQNKSLFISLMNQILLSHQDCSFSSHFVSQQEEILLGDDDDNEEENIGDDDDANKRAEKLLLPSIHLPSHNNKNGIILDSRLCPSFRVGLDQIESSLDIFLSTQAETKLILPEWNSFLQNVLEIYHRRSRTQNNNDEKSEEKSEAEQENHQQQQQSETRENNNNNNNDKKNVVVPMGSQEKNVLAEMIETRHHKVNHNNNIINNEPMKFVTVSPSTNGNSAIKTTISNRRLETNNDSYDAFEDDTNNNSNEFDSIRNQQIHQQQQQNPNQVSARNSTSSTSNHNNNNNTNNSNGRPSFQIQLQQPQQQEPPNTFLNTNNNNNNNQMFMKQQPPQQQQLPPPGFMAPTFNQARQGLMLPSSLKNATYQQRPTTTTSGMNQNNNNNQQQQQPQQQKTSNFSLHLGGGK